MRPPNVRRLTSGLAIALRRGRPCQGSVVEVVVEFADQAFGMLGHSLVRACLLRCFAWVLYVQGIHNQETSPTIILLSVIAIQVRHDRFSHFIRAYVLRQADGSETFAHFFRVIHSLNHPADITFTPFRPPLALLHELRHRDRGCPG